MITYSNRGHFYRANASRVVSAELSYGGRWKLQGWPGNFRVGYIEATGEVYAEHNPLCGEAGVVMVLGVVAPDRGDDEYYHTADRVIRDCWESRSTPSGLSQLIERVRDAGTLPCSVIEVSRE